MNGSWRQHSLCNFFGIGCAVLAALPVMSSCSPASPVVQAPVLAPLPSAKPMALPSAARTITIIGTNDLHGHIEQLPVLGGFVSNVRKVRARDGGGVLLVDAGDLFQGTLESNMTEGMAVLRAYATLGYQAATIGNHEFDYGPVGPAATPEKPGDDPRGALTALVAAASFPMLDANILSKATHQRFPLPHSPPSVIVEVAGIRVGIVGVTTAETLTTTISGNVGDLEMAPLAETIASEAASLRSAQHADVVVVLAHAGGKCKTFTLDAEIDQCEMDSEIFRVARALPKGSVDAIVAGHSHQGVAHTVAGIPIIESFAYGRAFGRIDLKLVEGPESSKWRVLSADIFPPQELCAGAPPATAPPPAGTRPGCTPPDYEGSNVVPDARVASSIAPDIERASARRADSLGVRVVEKIRRDYDHESAEGNLFADLLHKAHPDADVVMMNGGGLREDLPAGVLNYGALYESFPFDNKVATAKLRVSDLEKLLASHFIHSGGILSVSGIRVKAGCEKGELRVHVTRGNGQKLNPNDRLTLLASDFMMTGGDHFWGPISAPEVSISNEGMRDTLERELRAMKELKPIDAFDPVHPRLVYEGTRPLKCTKL